MSTLVIGVGSPLGDDRVGWEVVAALESALRGGLALPLPVHTCALDRPGAALINALQGAQHVVIVDAMRMGGVPDGTLRWLDACALDPLRSPSTHDFGLAEALALARALGHLPARNDVLAIAASRFDGEHLSDPVREAVPAAVQEILTLLQRRDCPSPEG